MPTESRAATSEGLFARARQIIPGGVNSPVRAFRSVGGTPRFMAAGSGSRIVDVDGNRYVDYVMSWGPLVLGHCHPEVVAAAKAAIDRGSSYGAPTRGEVELAEEIVGRVPGIEMVRCVSSGTEATMSAVRLARGFTGRSKIVKFAGHYHGHADFLLVSAGSGVATLGLPDSPGVTPGATGDTVLVEWNDAGALDAAFAEHAEDLAAVICEPVAANMGCVPPVEGFLQRIRDLTTAHGALFISDEVMTGFRVASGGMVELTGIVPDLVCFGKVVGGGFPLAAFAGPAAIMSNLAPAGPVYQAGTLSGNPVAVAAGLAQLRLLDAEAYAILAARADRLVDGLEKAFAAAGVDAVVQRAASLCAIYFSSAAWAGADRGRAPRRNPVRDYRGARAADHGLYARFFHGMLARGHYLPPSGYEALFVSTAHTEEDIDATVAAAADVAEELARGGAGAGGV